MHHPRSPSGHKSHRITLQETTGRWKTFTRPFPYEPETSARTAQQPGAGTEPCQGPFWLSQNKTIPNPLSTVIAPHIRLHHQNALRLTICKTSELSLSFLDPANTAFTMPNNNNPFSHLSNCHITFGNRPMHGDLSNFFNGTFSFDFDFKDLFNKANNDWNNLDISGIVITETSDHIKSCIDGHTSNADKNNIEAALQGLPFS